MLHGCTQTPQQMLTQTRMAKEAERKGFYLLLPQQTSANNTFSCWNWFKPENQARRPSGDSAFILSTLDKVIQEKNIDRTQVAIMGFSAGAAMTSNLVSCFPELFKAALIHSGLEYAAAQTMGESFQIMKNGPSRPVEKTVEMALDCAGSNQNIVPLYVVHGASDNIVLPVNFQRITKQFELMDAKIAASLGGRGELTREESTVSGAQLSAELTNASIDGRSVVKSFLVQGMQHAWSGGDSAVSYAEPRGIAISTLFADEFFSADSVNTNR